MHQRHSLVSQRQHPLSFSAALCLRSPSIQSAAPPRRSSLTKHRRILALQNTAKEKDKNEEQKDNVFVRLVVAAATETLRFIGVGSSPSSSSSSSAAAETISPGLSERPAPGDIAAVMTCLRSDYEERSYFITGVLSDGIYDENCYFADPTVAFTGRELWKRNLQLLVPFLENPSIQLIGLKHLESADSSEDLSREQGSLEKENNNKIVKLRADWILRCSLKLPWRPYINVVGSTEYDLAWPDNNRIVRHVESWDISAWEALILVFTPGKRWEN
jgi:Uncharacterized conserved protein (DUF2358)